MSSGEFAVRSRGVSEDSDSEAPSDDEEGAEQEKAKPPAVGAEEVTIAVSYTDLRAHET